MNFVHSIADRERGSRFCQNYDIALLRLKCYRDDVYRGISPNVDAPDFNPTPPIFACKFSTTCGFEEVIALANEDGKFALQDTKVKHACDTPLAGKQAHSDAIFDIAWMPQEMKLITVSGDQSARLWDVSSPDFTQIQTFAAHTRSVKSTAFRYQDKAVFATGARDGVIMIWDIRAQHSNQPKPDNCIYNAHYTNFPNKPRQRRTPSTKYNTAPSITSLVFQDDYTLISCSSGDGLIKVWDLRKNYTAHKKDPIAKEVMNYVGKTNKNGFTSLSICPAGITLYASCMDNTIYAYNISTYNSKPIAEYYGHKNSTFYVKACLSPDGKYLGSGSSDELAYIWHTGKPGLPLLKLSGHTEEVTCVAWCGIGESKIVSCSDDSCHRIWRIGPEHVSEDEKLNINGFAETISQSCNQVEISTSETTPTLQVSRCQPIRDCSSGSDITPVDTPNTYITEANNSSSGSIKRNHARMLNESCSEGNFKSILSPIQENLEAPTKRPNIENRGARRLFSPENKESNIRRGYESDDPSASSSRKLDMAPFSPTSNLPNFVIDGTAPHLLEMSPQKFKENIDWLTRIRKERYSQQSSKSAEKASPKNHTTPVRRTSRSRSTESRKTPKRPANPLLQFLRAAIQDCNNDLHESTNSTPLSSDVN